MAGTEEIRGGGLHRSNPTVKKAHATWPHQEPEAAFIAHRLLLEKNLFVTLEEIQPYEAYEINDLFTICVSYTKLGGNMKGFLFT